jgi:hypothetical protein
LSLGPAWHSFTLPEANPAPPGTAGLGGARSSIVKTASKTSVTPGKRHTGHKRNIRVLQSPARRESKARALATGRQSATNAADP